MTDFPGVKNWGSETLTSTDLDTYVSNAILHLYEKIPTGISPADRAGVSGGDTSEEWDTAITGLTWSPSSPTTADSNTTVKGHLYISNQTDATERIGKKSWSPAGAFDARLGRVMIASGSSIANVVGNFGLHIGDSTDANRCELLVNYNFSTAVTTLYAYTYTSSTYTQRGSTVTLLTSVPAYLRITRDGSNNCSFYWSHNGVLWQFIATQSFTFTVANIGVRASGNTTAGFQSSADWLRTSV